MRFRTETGILLGALGLITGALSCAGAGPAAAGTVEPSGEREAGVYLGDARTDLGKAGGTAPKITYTSSPAHTPSAIPRPGPHGGAAARGRTTAATGTGTERLWLLGGLGLALAATGVVAVAAMRGRREY
ncbi:hypothetical protein ACFY8W_12265 [Streptomyces sp. NPDC012637]|uniref:hypothetical protein n=1 Tax=Streptomyces sp. NPDC012637 TaxID=3364842 RepID=UPI0036EC1602